LNGVGHREALTRNNFPFVRKFLEKKSRKTLVVPNSLQIIEKSRGRNYGNPVQCPMGE